ncbi:hypothetical protein K7B10_36155 [Streptomyces flavotricini]|uniref:Uncharacterized protein n=1 Tax=Streptomyces flavotricini TaxID=66888 RepID=A0ABS8EGD0_9ACTN|nr:hypothetical protein [Streptomyces flavotricini]MCC0100126.1 hypothetical protein [Streptomyces flavotricini]
MNTTGDERIGVVALGTTRTRGAVRAAAGARLLVRTPGLVEVHDREEFLAGRTASASAALRTTDQERVAPTPGGGFVVAGPASVRALDRDGGTLWELPHDPWHGAARARSVPAVSPDGRRVGVVVPVLEPDEAKAALVYDAEPDRNYTWDDLLLLDAATGEVLGRRQVRSLASAAVQSWSPDGGALVVSCWTAWQSWSTWWAQPCADGLPILGGTWMHALAGFLPGSRVLTQRYAEYVFPADDRDELGAYDLGSGDQVAALDLAELAVDPEDDEFFSAEVLDAHHVLVPGRVHPDGGPPRMRHWLLNADTLRPIGRLDYPVPVGEEVTALDDGTWLTQDGDRLHRWGLARTNTPESGAR